MTLARWQNSIEQIMLAAVGPQERILGLTSLRPGAGVSLVCHHIARTAAAGEFKTLLLDISEPHTPDAPVRTWRPGHDKISNLITPTVGRYDYLKFRTDEATRPLFCNPEKLRSVYRTELEQYELVVVDLPPLLEPSELGPNPVAAAGSCDQVLLLCAVGRDTRSELADAISLVGGAGGKLAGLVSNEYLYEQPLEQIGRLAGSFRAVPWVARLPLVACRWIAMWVATVIASVSGNLVADAKALLWATYRVARLPVVALRWIATCVAAAGSWMWAKLIGAVMRLLRATLWLALLPVAAVRWIATRIGMMVSWLSWQVPVAAKAVLRVVHWLARLPMVALRWMAACIAMATSWTAAMLVYTAKALLRAVHWVAHLPLLVGMWVARVIASVSANLVADAKALLWATYRVARLPVVALRWIATCVAAAGSWMWAKLIGAVMRLLRATLWLALLPVAAVRWIATRIGMMVSWLSWQVPVAAKAVLRVVHWLARLPMVALRWMAACIAMATSWTAAMLVYTAKALLRAVHWVAHLPLLVGMWVARVIASVSANLVADAKDLLWAAYWVARLPVVALRWIATRVAAAGSWMWAKLIGAVMRLLRATLWLALLPVAAVRWIATRIGMMVSWLSWQVAVAAKAVLRVVHWLARLPMVALRWMAACIAMATSWTATKLVLAATYSLRAARWVLRLPVGAYRVFKASLFAAAAKISDALLRFGRGAFRTASHLWKLPSRLIGLLSRAAEKLHRSLASDAGHRSVRELQKVGALSVLLGGAALIALVALDPLGSPAKKGNQQLNASLTDARPPMLKTAALDVGSYRGELSTIDVPAVSGLPASRTDGPPAIRAPTVATSLPEPDDRLHRTSDSPTAPPPDAMAPEMPKAAPHGGASVDTTSTPPPREPIDQQSEQTAELRATVVVADATPTTGTPRLTEARTGSAHVPAAGRQSGTEADQPRASSPIAPSAENLVVVAPGVSPTAVSPAVDASHTSPSAQPDPASEQTGEAVTAPLTIAAAGSDAPSATVVTPPDSSSFAPPAAPVDQQAYPAGQATTQPAANVAAVVPPEAPPAISPPRLTDTGAQTDRSSPAPARIPTLSSKERERVEQMVARGERDLADGNVAQARLFFLSAAKAGLPRGALLLAATYDPRELTRPSILGVRPNIALARQWYERARELGATEAAERLGGLVGR